MKVTVSTTFLFITFFLSFVTAESFRRAITFKNKNEWIVLGKIKTTGNSDVRAKLIIYSNIITSRNPDISLIGFTKKQWEKIPKGVDCSKLLAHDHYTIKVPLKDEWFNLNKILFHERTMYMVATNCHSPYSTNIQGRDINLEITNVSYELLEEEEVVQEKSKKEEPKKEEPKKEEPKKEEPKKEEPKKEEPKKEEPKKESKKNETELPIVEKSKKPEPKTSIYCRSALFSCFSSQTGSVRPLTENLFFFLMTFLSPRAHSVLDGLSAGHCILSVSLAVRLCLPADSGYCRCVPVPLVIRWLIGREVYTRLLCP